MSGSPVTGSPSLDQDHSLVLSNVITGSPTLDSPVCNTFELQLSATGVTTGTPILADQRLGGYTNARNNFFTYGVTSYRSGYFETDSTYFYANFHTAVPSSSIVNTSTYVEFTGYIKRVGFYSSEWYSATFRLNKSGSIPVEISNLTLAYSSGNPPSAGSRGHVGLDDIVSSPNELSWLDDSFSHSTADSTAFPVEVTTSYSTGQLKLENLSGTTVYDTYNRPNWSTGGQTGFMFGGGFTVNRWRVDLLGIYGGNYYTASSRIYSTRFGPPQPFVTSDATLTHLETGLGLLGFDTGVPVVGNATLILNQQIAANDVSSGIPIVGSPSSTQSQVLYPIGVEAQLPVVAATSISQDHSVEAVDTSTQSPVLQSPDVDQDHVLGASDVSAGTPVVGSSNVSEFQSLGVPSGILTGSPVVGNANVILNYQFDANSVSAETPVVGSPDLTQVTLSVSPSSITTGSPDLTNVVFLQGHALAPSDITTALAEVGQTSFVFKGRVGALNSVTVSLSKNSTTVNLSINSVG
jgi:hypothetical protein